MPPLALVFATFLMVSGGPYGLEEIVGDAGYGWAIALLLLLPLIWSLPTALMVGELASAIPAEGGFYVWVSRALGPFWGVQEAWLSLTASIFDMALYPTLFTAYLGQLAPALSAGHRAWLLEIALIAACILWNLRGAYDVGEASRWMSCVLLLPFAVLVIAAAWSAFTHPATHATPAVPLSRNFSAALLVALWNTMGWDNASTVAQEVDRPQRTYPRAMLAAVALVTFSYILPIAAAWVAGIPAPEFSNGAWVLVAQQIGGRWLAIAITAGGALTGLAMFNALTMSYSRLPFALAEDGWLPRVFTRRNARGVPWAAVVALGVCWSLAASLSFDRLITMDVLLYGSSLVLEFVALAVLRRREPALPRPFRIAGGAGLAWLLGLPTLVLLACAAWLSRSDRVLGYPAWACCAAIAACGPLAYSFAKARSAVAR